MPGERHAAVQDPDPSPDLAPSRVGRAAVVSLAMVAAATLTGVAAAVVARTGCVTPTVASATAPWLLPALATLLSLAALGGGLVAEAERRALHRRNRRLVDLVTTDPLTGLGNRRSFDEVLSVAWRSAGRRAGTVSLILADADHFKAFNDTHGHQEGDRLLRMTGRVMADAMRRAADRAFRIGGEEFAILLPDTNAAGAAVVAAGIRAGIATLSAPARLARGRPFTLSMGIAEATPGQGQAGEQALFAAADRALYRAKADGRNRIRVVAFAGPPAAGRPAADEAVAGLEIVMPGGRTVVISETITVAKLRSILGVLRNA